ncbi:MAG: hypothetical protein GY832_41515 [Chloroflexi bacterium]|nr:hypothetical protein [Chloroflexota bacterium]
MTENDEIFVSNDFGVDWQRVYEFSSTSDPSAIVSLAQWTGSTMIKIESFGEHVISDLSVVDSSQVGPIESDVVTTDCGKSLAIGLRNQGPQPIIQPNLVIDSPAIATHQTTLETLAPWSHQTINISLDPKTLL